MQFLRAGEMAKLNGITKKTLYIYQDAGLLMPEKIDEETGYRYYTLDQCSTLDMIKQLQDIGLTLVDIKRIADTKDVQFTEDVLKKQMLRLEGEKKNIELSLSNAQRYLEACTVLQNRPQCEVIKIEQLKKRQILRYDVKKYPVQQYLDQDPKLSNWEKSLRDIKRQMTNEYMPLSLFRHVGCIVDKESLLCGKYVCTGGFVFYKGTACKKKEYFEAGTYMTVLIDKTFSEQGEHMEYKYISLMLKEIEKLDYKVVGDYFGEVIADTPAFVFEGRDMMIKMCIPIQKM